MNDPFSLVTSKLDPLEEYLAEIDRLKMEDIVVEITQLKNWCIPWMLRTHRVQQGSGTDSQVRPPQSSQLKPSGRERLENTAAIQRQELYSTVLSSPAHKKRLWSWLPRHLDSIFKCTLTKDPTKRDLEATIKFLESDQIDSPLSIGNLDLSTTKIKDESTHIANSQAAESDFKNWPSALLDQCSKVRFTVTNNTGRNAEFRFTEDTRQDTSFPKAQQKQLGSAAKIDWAKLGFKHHRYSWQNIRDLEPGVQKFVVKCLSHVDDPADAACDFILSGCLVNAYGIGFDAQKAIDHMVKSARNGHAGARANLYRMSVTCGKSLGPDVPVAHYLKEAVRNGSRSALQDLIQLRRQEGIDEWKLLRYAYAGVGADWYCQKNWLYGLDQPSFLETDFDIMSLGEIADLPHLIVNVRGDGIIHAAAALGACSFLEPLLKDSTLDINQRNAHGETAILCACRSGHSDMVKLLLDHEADASLQALNGESALHWLSSFDPNSINTVLVGQDLITRGGAKVDAVTTERVSHSGTYRSIDVDFQMPGTPLAWAVHDNNPQAVAFLLSEGANPNICPENAALSPLGWAAFFHRHYCLKLIIEHLEKVMDASPAKTQMDHRWVATYGPLVQHAIHAADNFSMMLRNGVQCLDLLQSTLAYLQEKTKYITFHLKFDETILHFAAREGHDQAVKFILKLDWLVDQINKPSGQYGRTAILESVRWNHLSLFRRLLEHKADPRVLSASPYDESEAGRIWSALHLFADQAHNENMAIVDNLLAAGLRVDGDPTHDIETPLSIAIRRNAFHLAAHLQENGASLEATSRHSSLIISRRKLTILGHTITLNGRHSFDSIDYLLAAGANFLVCPDEGLTALHLCAMVPHDLTYSDGTPLKRSEFDSITSRMITNTILRHFNSPEQLDQRSLKVVPRSSSDDSNVQTCDTADREPFENFGETALFLAVKFGNIQVVELLLAAGADKELMCLDESMMVRTAAKLAEKLYKQHQPQLYHGLMEYLVN